MKFIPPLGQLMLKANLDVTPRDYQTKIALGALTNGNTLVVLPTGMGKTLIATLVIARMLNTNPNSKFLFLAPTKPLATQLHQNLSTYLDIPNEKIALLTGDQTPDKRLPLYLTTNVICATPQTIESDILSRKCDLNDFALIVFDECHRVVGEYAYSFIARNAKCKLLGLTASPSSDDEKVQEICKNLKIENVETTTTYEVAQYKKDVKLEWLHIESPPWLPEIKKQLTDLIKETAQALKTLNYLESADVNKVNKRILLQTRSRILENMKVDKSAYQAMSLQAKLMNLLHAMDLLESQGLIPLHEFLSKLKDGESKAAQTLASDFRIQKAIFLADKFIQQKENHPKEATVLQILNHDLKTGSTAILFAHYKNTVERLTKILNENNISAQALTGKGAGGMTRKKQDAIVNSFRNNEFKVLVCTSVGEEGLDLTSVDLVLFYEPVPSEIRLIQRRGRAGRAKEGKVIVLIAKGTKDEAMFWSSRRKEREMQSNVDELKNKYTKQKQQTHADKPEHNLKLDSTGETFTIKPAQKKMTEF